MKQRKTVICVLSCAVGLALSAGVFADEKATAVNAAQVIMSTIANKQYNSLWDSHTSTFFQERVTKDSFIANLSIGRLQLGALSSSKVVDVQHATYDPTYNYKGQIYSVTFLNHYQFGNFYERIVVLKEDDGRFRLAGLWGAPAPKN